MFITVFLVIPSDHTQINWYTKRGVLAALYGSTGRLKITTGTLGQVCVCKFGALTKVQRQLRMQLAHFWIWFMHTITALYTWRAVISELWSNDTLYILVKNGITWKIWKE